MDLQLLENVVCIAEERSITRAAEKRFITQSALNQQLQKLEAELGTPLFIRARGNWQPTPAGAAYLETARQMLLMKQDTYHRIADLAERQRRRLVIGLIPERGVEMFTAVYPRFHAAYPDMDVEPVECSVTVMQRRISRGELNLGLATLIPRQQDDNDYHLLATEEIVLAVPASSPLSEGGSCLYRDAPVTDFARFAEAPFVRIYQQSTLFDVTQPLFEEAGFVPRVLFSTASSVSKLRIVATGLACALLPAVYARADDRVRYLRLPQRPEWQITLCSRRGAYFGRPEAAYVALCRDYWQRCLCGA